LEAALHPSSVGRVRQAPGFSTMVARETAAVLPVKQQEPAKLSDTRGKGTSHAAIRSTARPVRPTRTATHQRPIRPCRTRPTERPLRAGFHQSTVIVCFTGKTASAGTVTHTVKWIKEMEGQKTARATLDPSSVGRVRQPTRAVEGGGRAYVVRTLNIQGRYVTPMTVNQRYAKTLLFAIRPPLGPRNTTTRFQQTNPGMPDMT